MNAMEQGGRLARLDRAIEESRHRERFYESIGRLSHPLFASALSEARYRRGVEEEAAKLRGKLRRVPGLKRIA